MFQSLAALAERLDRAHDLRDGSALVAEFAVQHLGSDVAGISMRQAEGLAKGPAERLAATSPDLAGLDRVQAEMGQGPGNERLAEGSVITIADTRTDALWPDWSAAAAQRALLSVRLVGMPPIRGRSVTLQLFARRPQAFAADSPVRVGRAAKHAGLALRHVDRIANLEEAMHTRALIGQAQGIIMERYDLTSEQAMSFLRRSSQQSQVKVRELAERLVAVRDAVSGQSPPTSGLRSPGDQPPRAR